MVLILPHGRSSVPKCSRSCGHGHTNVTIISGIILSLVGFAFVGDVDLLKGAIDVDTL